MLVALVALLASSRRSFAAFAFATFHAITDEETDLVDPEYVTVRPLVSAGTDSS